MGRGANSRLAFTVSGTALLWTCIVAGVAHAGEIVAVVDERGRRIYTNTHQLPPKPIDWATRASQAQRAATSSNYYEDVDRLVQEVAGRFQLDPRLVHAIIQAESDYNPLAVSPRGALGLMQLIPATARRFGVADPFDPKQNIEGGVSYLKYLLDLFGGNLSLSLAAYNAGENSVLRWGGVPSFSETKAYVRKVREFYQSNSLPYMPASKPVRKRPEMLPIYRYVDERGIVHYTNID